jgi:bifunctional non-homologous end joining protein LigD
MPSRSLASYRAKRDFKKSPEPAGGKSAKAKGPPRAKSKARRFCVQKHLASHLHYDFRLEHRGVLLSWAVPKGPSLNPADKRLAMMTEDHPLDYGDFEGVIPEGYGAGIVMLWDAGTWRLDGDDDSDAAVDRALDKGEVKFSLEGAKLKGGWVLVRTRGFGDRSWLLIKHRDHWSGDINVAEVAPNSVNGSGGFAEILAGENPRVWLSNKDSRGAALFKDGTFSPPARGGEAGAMYRDIVAKAIALTDKRRKKNAKKNSKKDGKRAMRRPARPRAKIGATRAPARSRSR